MTVELMLGDCLELMKAIPDKSIDAVITDPPYPDYHQDKYGVVDIKFLVDIRCRQFVFWSAKCNFPIDYTAIHIWDKKTGIGSEYERIFERNGESNFKVFRHYLINSIVAASYAHDIFTGHPSQKPIILIQELIERFTEIGDTVLDPFMGSGTTGVACAKLGRNFIGIEINPEYFAIAQKRIEAAQAQLVLPL